MSAVRWPTAGDPSEKAVTRSREQVIDELTSAGGPFQIVEQVVRGVPMRVYAVPPRTLRDVLVSTAQFGDSPFLVYADERWTFAEHLRIVARVARHFRDAFGVAKGDRVAIAMRNYPEWAVAFWACQALGAVTVPLNAWWTGPELAYAIRDSGAKVLVADGERAERVRPELPGLAMAAVVVARAGSPAPGTSAPGLVRWEDVLAAGDAGAELPEADIDTDDDATIMYTSGTTGAPKGAIATHRNHCTNFLNTMLGGAVGLALAAESGAAQAAPPPLCALQTFPFFHIAGLTGLYCYTGFGGKLVLMYKWDTEEAVKLIETEHVTALAMVPTLVRRLLESPGLASRGLSSLAGIAAGGAPVPPDLITRIGADFDRKVSPVNGYGLTETTSAVIANVGEAYFEHPDSVGRPVPGTDVRIVDPGGSDARTGDVGELWVRGPNVVRGYWNRPAETSEAFTGGWFHTGDLGYVDADGYVYVVDRLKDVVIRGGENVYCAEVENVLFQHPAVFDAAVIGLPDPVFGEEVAAVIQPRPGIAADTEDIRAFAAVRLAGFKVPTRVVLRDEPLPRNAVGKVLKRELRGELVDAGRDPEPAEGA
jgi:long-chain acyl-CoA synthetase